MARAQFGHTGWADNQLGRRNLSPEQAKYLRGRRYEMVKQKLGGTGANQYTQKVQNEPSANTSEKLASQFGVGKSTIKRDAAYARARDAITDTYR